MPQVVLVRYHLRHTADVPQMILIRYHLRHTDGMPEVVRVQYHCGLKRHLLGTTGGILTTCLNLYVVGAT